jgi:UDP-2,3-diacylglucosamine hydrolase
VTTLFISDLHLDAAHADITRRFVQFIDAEARSSAALYILGDLFESWAGDDDADEAQRQAMAALRRLTDAGVPCFIMHGNRDFLLGERFCTDTGATLLHDPLMLTLYGSRVLVMHGDALCTDDHSYQRLRATVRDAGWQRRFLSLPLDARRALAQAARAGSQAHTAGLTYSIADVNQASVEAVLRAAGADCLLHGHTHRPGIHTFLLDGIERRRIVLGDWYEHGSVLRWSAAGYALTGLGAV